MLFFMSRLELVNHLHNTRVRGFQGHRCFYSFRCAQQRGRR